MCATSYIKGSTAWGGFIGSIVLLLLGFGSITNYVQQNLSQDKKGAFCAAMVGVFLSVLLGWTMGKIARHSFDSPSLFTETKEAAFSYLSILGIVIAILMTAYNCPDGLSLGTGSLAILGYLFLMNAAFSLPLISLLAGSSIYWGLLTGGAKEPVTKEKGYYTEVESKLKNIGNGIFLASNSLINSKPDPIRGSPDTSNQIRFNGFAIILLLLIILTLINFGSYMNIEDYIDLGLSVFV